MNSLISDLLRSVYGVSFDDQRERFLVVALSIASFALAAASFYTTFRGANQYVPAFFASLIALGINIILLATSWRIGAMFVSGTLKLIVTGIFLATFIISVFFSYSALLDKIYPQAARERDELRRSRILTSDVIRQVTNELRSVTGYEETISESREKLDTWHTQTVNVTGPMVNSLRNSYASKTARYDQYTESIDALQNQPLTRKRAIHLEREIARRGALRSSGIAPLNDLIKRLNDAEKAFSNSYFELTKSDQTLTTENPAKLQAAYKTFTSLLSTKSSAPTQEIPKEVPAALETIDQVNAFLAIEKQLDFAAMTNLTDVRKALSDLVSRLPGTSVSNRSDEERKLLLEQLDRIGRYGGQKAHPFVLAANELNYGNYLAVGALLIAIAIDGLVLFAGVVSARPASMLVMRNPDLLMEVVESSLDAVMSLNLESRARPGILALIGL
ncbi:MAG TPA: hypothetical protein VGO47_09470 [Chlamydiales bacterium]|jgi:hypothetical protein|nr:hypothetical protein [Chlamydiales bacterium]